MVRLFILQILSGTYIGYDAVAIGAGSDQVTEFLEKNYKSDLSMEEGASASHGIYLPGK